MLKFLGILFILVAISSCASTRVIVKNCEDYKNGYKSCELVTEE